MLRKTMLMFLLLLILLVTSQFIKWQHELVGHTEFQMQHQISNVEADLEESIVVMQEKHINKLNELILNLKEELQRCRSSIFTPTSYSSGRTTPHSCRPEGKL